jgi:micrococcal nuclease
MSGWRRLAAALVLILVGAAAVAVVVATRDAASGGDGAATAVVARVVDGDTIVLDTGTTVRLVQVDAPERGEGECYAEQATVALARLAPVGTAVRVEPDPALDGVDRFGRTLAYVFARDVNVNEALVAEGAASVWFFRGARGRYAEALLAAVEDARAAGRGLWGACSATLDPLAPVATAPRG